MSNNINYKKLIQETLSGNEESFNMLAASVQPVSKFYALSIAKDDYIASEAAQLSIIKMYQSLADLKDLDYFEGWYKRIVRNTTLDLLKKENREINFSAFNENEDDNFEYSIADEKIDYQPELKFAQSEKEKMILDIVSALPDNQRTPIMMYFYEDMKIRDIAQELDVPESTIKTRLTAGKKSIRARVEQIQHRDGIKLYNVSPLGFFIWLIKGNSSQLIATGVSATALAGAAAAATSARGTFLSTLWKSVIFRIIAGTTALSLTATGTYMAVRAFIDRKIEEPLIEEVVEKIETAEEEQEIRTYTVTYAFVGRNNISLPAEVMAKLPKSLSEQPSGTVVAVSAIDNVRIGNYTYRFEGWDRNDVVIEDSDVTITGTWSRTEDVIRYNVYYRFVSSTGESMPDSIYDLLPATAVYNKGDTAVAPAINDNIKGWTFKGWDHDAITLENGDVTFVGTWKKKTETVQADPTPAAEEPVATYQIYYSFTGKLLDGTIISSDELPEELIALFPREYWYQVVPEGQDPVEPPMQPGDVYYGWRYRADGGAGFKDSNDKSYCFCWDQVE